MIAQHEAAKQVARFASLRFFNSTEPEGREELLRTLEACAVDERHAQTIVDQWLAEESEMPTPSDLRRLASACRPPDAGGTARPDPSCEACQGTGFATAWYLATMQGFHNPVRYEFLAELDPLGRRPPEVAGMEDRLTSKGSIKQQVVTASRRCTACGGGRALEPAKQMAQHAEPEKKQRGQSVLAKPMAVQHGFKATILHWKPGRGGPSLQNAKVSGLVEDQKGS